MLIRRSRPHYATDTTGSPPKESHAAEAQPFLNQPCKERNNRATTAPQTTPVLRPRSGLIALGLLVASTGCVGSPSDETRQNLAPLPIGRPMYQVDAQHTGRSLYIRPRQPLLSPTFDTSVVPAAHQVTSS